MNFNEIKTGMAVRVVQNTAGHGYTVGKEYVVHSVSGSAVYLSEIGSTVKGNSFAAPKDLELSFKTRAEYATYLRENALPVETAKLEAQTKAVEDLKAKIARYEKYPTREDEAADLLHRAFATKGDKAAILEFIKSSGILNIKAEEL